jgi:hypothetical protein
MASARLAQSAERKALNLVVVGSSPTVGDLLSVVNVQMRRLRRRYRQPLPGRLELPTLRLTASRSNQLSYGSTRAEGNPFPKTARYLRQPGEGGLSGT